MLSYSTTPAANSWWHNSIWTEHSRFLFRANIGHQRLADCGSAKVDLSTTSSRALSRYSLRPGFWVLTKSCRDCAQSLWLHVWPASFLNGLWVFRLYIFLSWFSVYTVVYTVWDQCKKKYILRTDRPTTNERRPHIWENFKWSYLREGSSDPLHVWFYGGVFGVGGSNGAISGFVKSRWRLGKLRLILNTTTSYYHQLLR